MSVSTKLTITLDPALQQELTAIAAQRGVTRAELVRMACRSFVAQVREHEARHRPVQATPATPAYRPQDAALWDAAWIGDLVEDEDAGTDDDALLDERLAQLGGDISTGAWI